MPLGIFSVVSCIIIGGTIGSRLGKRLPDKIKDTLPLTFSVATFAMAITSLVKMQNLPPVILSLILGTVIGTVCQFERLLRHAGERAAALFSGNTMVDGHGKQHYLHLFSVAVILFCTGPTGIYGSIHSSISGDHSFLFSKSILDLFTAGIFAASIGGVIVILAIPVFVIFISFYLLAGVLAPLITPAMFADFSGIGGILLLATGFRMAEIKMYPVADMLPAMFLVMPLSHLWSLLPL